MGALTDNRKRCFVDLCFPVSPSSLPSTSRSDLFPDTPLQKKHRVSPPVPQPAFASVQTPPTSLVEKQLPVAAVRPQLARFPPAAPLRRQVQGPQRTIRVFGLGKSVARPQLEWVDVKRSKTTMGNFLSRVVNKTPLRSVWSSGKGKALVEDDGKGHGFVDGDYSGLKLDEYKRLVEGIQDSDSDRERREISTGKADLSRTPSSAVSDLTILTRKDGNAAPSAHILTRKVDDAAKMVRVDLTREPEDAKWQNRTPLYKELLEETTRKYDSKLSSLGFEVKLAEKKMSGFRITSKEKPKEEKDGPFSPLTDEEVNDVSMALQEPDRPSLRRAVLVLHKESNIEITREIMQCLTHGAWLNDEVINLYFELLKEREKRDPKKFLKCHFFSTFFYKRLTGGRDEYDYKAVRRWTTQRKLGYGLIECDKIFVPIHKEIHWCLAVINVKDEKFQYLDSLGGMDHGVLDVLARYLADEAKEKSNKVIDTRLWKQEFVDNLPLQKNGWDCGMFMIKYADFHSRGLALCFGQEHMSYFRMRTVKEILRLKAD